MCERQFTGPDRPSEGNTVCAAASNFKQGGLRHPFVKGLK